MEKPMKGETSLIRAGAGILLIATAAPALASFNGQAIIPEPATWLLLGSGLAGLAAYKWYRSR
jgi:hypothetical protein